MEKYCNPFSRIQLRYFFHESKYLLLYIVIFFFSLRIDTAEMKRREEKSGEWFRYRGFSCRFVARQRGRGLIHYVATALTLEGGFSSVAHTKTRLFCSSLVRANSDITTVNNNNVVRNDGGPHKVRFIHIHRFAKFERTVYRCDRIQHLASRAYISSYAIPSLR